MSLKLSPLAPAGLPPLAPIAGVRIAAVESGLRYKNRTDFCLFELAPGTVMAGVLTRSLTASASVEWCKAGLKSGGRARAILVNAGNANAFTGKLGMAAVKTLGTAVGALIGAAAKQVFQASTGVIGVPLPAERLTPLLPALQGKLSEDGWEQAARAIMTTDTYPKGASVVTDIGGTKVTITGVCKGSGMIAPDMATMLAFVATDADLPQGLLQQILEPAADASFNAITVDGDTSTSDTLLLAATGQAGNSEITRIGDPRLKNFKAALQALLIDLAQQVVKDGEGAEKFVTVTVTGAASMRAAQRIGLAIANSPLVKTAIAGADANWGRIVMAVGKSGEKADRDRLGISIGGTLVAAKGAVVPGYDEAPVALHMKGRDIVIEVDVAVGTGSSTVWTCDLTHGYIDINADYRS